MPSRNGAAAYCPACDHLLRDRDVVKRVGRHMDGIDPTFNCRVCDTEVTHPSRAPAGTETYESGTTGSRDGSGTADFSAGARTVIADGTPPINIEGVNIIGDTQDYRWKSVENAPIARVNRPSIQIGYGRVVGDTK